MGIFDSTVFDPTIFQTQRVIRPVPVSAVAGRVNPAIAITVIAVAAVAAAVNPVVQASVTPTPASVIAGRMNPRTAVTGTSRFDYQPTPSRLSPKFYYIRAVNKSGLASAWAGPANVDAAPDNTIALVTGISVSEGPGFARDGHAVSKVTCSFTAPSPVLNWDGIEIWITGYHGGTIPFRVAASNTSPLIFDLESTNETITLYFTSFAVEGRRTTVASSPSTTVLLDGQVSAPVPVSNLTGQVSAAQGQIVRLSWLENVEADIDHYEIARKTSPAAVQGDIVATDVIASKVAAGLSASSLAQWVDASGVADIGAARYYYVRAVNLTGLASDWRPDPPATLALTALAPDGSTDTGVPQGNYFNNSGSLPWPLGTILSSNDGSLRFYVDPAQTVVKLAYSGDPTSVAGIFALNVKLTYTGGDGLGAKTFQFVDDGSVATLKHFNISLPNASVTDVEHWFVNYYGNGVHWNWHPTGPILTGSQATDLMNVGGNVDPAKLELATNAVRGAVMMTTATSAVAVATDDARNTNARTPTAHAHPESDVTNLVSDLAGKAAATHAAQHKNGGGDEVATATPTTNAIPKTAGATTLAAGWIPDLSATYAPVGDIVKAITTGKKIAWGTPQLSGGTWSGATGLADIEHCILTFTYGTTPPVDTLSWGHSGGTLSIYCSNVASTFYVSYIAIGT